MKKNLNIFLGFIASFSVGFSLVACTHNNSPQPPPAPKKVVDLSKEKFISEVFCQFDKITNPVSEANKIEIENNISESIVTTVNNDYSSYFSFKISDFKITYAVTTYENPVKVNVGSNNQSIRNSQQLNIKITKKQHSFNDLTDGNSEFPEAFQYYNSSISESEFIKILPNFKKDFTKALNFFWNSNFIDDDYTCVKEQYIKTSNYADFFITIFSNNSFIDKNSKFICELYIYNKESTVETKADITNQYNVTVPQLQINSFLTQNEYDSLKFYARLLLNSDLSRFNNKFFGAIFTNKNDERDYYISGYSISVNDKIVGSNFFGFIGSGDMYTTKLPISGTFSVIYLAKV